jgi:hypothetical protein
MQLTSGTRYYFVDEAGDATLFDARGHVIVGAEGECCRLQGEWQG